MPGDSFSGFVIAGITFLLIIGYGNTLARQDLAPVDSTFWVSTIVFYLVCASIVVSRGYERFFMGLENSFAHFRDAFMPHFEPHLALNAVGGFSFVAIAIWMPVAAILSLIVFANLLGQRRLEKNAPS